MSTFYGDEDQEILSAESVEEYIQEYIERVYPDDPEETIAVYKYKTKEVDIRDSNGWFEHIEESLSEKYGEPDEYVELPEECKEAWVKFVHSVKTKFTPWQCEKDGEPIIVKIKDYIGES